MIIYYYCTRDSSINWDNPTNTLSSSFTYVVSVVLVTTRETIDQQTVVVTHQVQNSIL